MTKKSNTTHMVTFRTEEPIAKLFKAYCRDKGVSVTWALSMFMAMAVSHAFDDAVDPILSEKLEGATCYQQEFLVLIRQYMSQLLKEMK
jgi:hypothetical protein